MKKLPFTLTLESGSMSYEEDEVLYVLIDVIGAIDDGVKFTLKGRAVKK